MTNKLFNIFHYIKPCNLLVLSGLCNLNLTYVAHFQHQNTCYNKYYGNPETHASRGFQRYNGLATKAFQVLNFLNTLVTSFTENSKSRVSNIRNFWYLQIVRKGGRVSNN